MKANLKIFNSGRQRIIRFMTPIGMRYEDAYAKAHPFDKLVEGMLQPEMLLETSSLMRKAIEAGALKPAFSSTTGRAAMRLSLRRG